MYKYLEVDSDDEKHGVPLDTAFYGDSNSTQYFNPDELYFNDMDIRAWEQRTAELDGLAYGDDYSYLEDEGYYEELGDSIMSITEYEDLLFQRVLDKIRVARSTGDSDVQLTPEELEVYQAKLLGPRAPAARPQPPIPRHASAPTVPTGSSTAVASTPSAVGVSASSSTRAKKSSRRTSIFGSRRSKDKDKDKDKSSTRTRAPSISSDASAQTIPPAFVVPDPNVQPVYAPTHGHHSRRPREAHALPHGSPPRPASRAASISSDRLIPTKPAHPGDARASRQAPTPTRISPPRDMPGAFPGSFSSSARSHPNPTPPQTSRPASSSSRLSNQETVDPRLVDPRQFPSSRPRSASIQQSQPPKLVSLAMPTTEPFQYQLAGQLAPSQPPSYVRRIAPTSDSAYTPMPRRVPVPEQRAASVVGSASDPNVAQRTDVSNVGDGNGTGGVLVDAVPSPDERSYKVHASSSGARSGTKDGPGGGSGRDKEERRKKSSKSRRKH